MSLSALSAPEPAPGAPHPEPLPPARLSVAVAVALLFATWHAVHNAPLAASVLLQSFNWLFDFDASRFVAWCTPGQPADEAFGLSFVGRHPLTVAMRPLCWPLLPLAGSAQAALMLLTALVAGAAAAIAYLLAAACVPREPDRVLLALCFGLWAQPLVQGLVPEAYGWAMAGIGLHFWLLSRSAGPGLPLQTPRWAVVSLVINVGITITNAGLDLLSSVVRAWGRVPLKAWLRANTRVALLALGLVVAAAVIGAWWVAPSVLGRGSALAKEIWWIVNINRAEPATGWQVLWTFFVTNVVAPGITLVDLAPGEAHWMADYRALRYGAVGWAAVACWLLLFGAATALVLRSPTRRRDGLIALVWILANAALHTYWQFRGSVFIYGPHMVFALFALLVWGWREAELHGHARVARIGLGVLTLLLALNNLPAYEQVIDFAVTPPPHADAPPK